MTTMTQPDPRTTQWHVNNNPAHTTRHPEPAHWTHTWAIEDLTEQQKLHGTAIHEAAHTVLLCAAGVPIHRVLIRTTSEATADLPTGETDRGPYSVNLFHLLAGLCAGERAEDHWLHQTSQWSPGRAWAIERHAINDRAMADEAIHDTNQTRLTYGTSTRWNDLTQIHATTDTTLARYWTNITDLAGTLIHHRTLNARQITRYARIDNPAA